MIEIIEEYLDGCERKISQTPSGKFVIDIRRVVSTPDSSEKLMNGWSFLCSGNSEEEVRAMHDSLLQPTKIVPHFNY